MGERLLEIEDLAKEYRLGMIGGGSLHADLASWWARARGREDPNRKIGAGNPGKIQYFMALDGVNLAVDSGDALAIIGRNGAGKSTLLKLISRITAPTRGEIRIHGRVACLLEIGAGFHPELTGRENIYLNGAVMGMSRMETNSKLKEIIEFSEIAQFIDTPVKRYSSGMYVKLAFAVAAHLDPDILICDEVLAVGDVAFQQKCLSKMSDVAQGGRAVLYVSHNMRTVAQLCNRGLFLNKGRLEYDGETSRAIDLYAGSGNRDVDRNLDELPRGKNRGDAMRMLKMHMLDSSTMEYQMDDRMEFSITARTSVHDSRLRLRLILKNSVAAPLGMTQTPSFEVRPGDVFTKRISFSMDGLAAGEYTLGLTLAGADMRGGSILYDTIEDAGHFFIADDPQRTSGFTWDERLWGNICLKDLDMQDVGGNET